MHKNKNDRISMYKQLRINTLLYNGLTPSEINSSLYKFDNELKKYITATKNTMIDKRRIMYAYYLIYLKDINEAQKEYESAQK